MFKLIFSPAESYTSLSDRRRARMRRRRWHQTVASAAPPTPEGSQETYPTAQAEE